MDSPWQYFTNEELICKGTDCCQHDGVMHDEFMPKIVILRRELGFPFILSSAYRCPNHNQEVSRTGRTGPHTTGRSVDIAVYYQYAVRLLEAVILSGMFTGVGVNQRGRVKDRFIHLDDIPGPDRLWTY